MGLFRLTSITEVERWHRAAYRVGRFMFLLLGALLFVSSCGPDTEMTSLTVTATAYNSVPSQTFGDPFETAWGDRLEPGMHVIAVSHDLLDMGLGHKSVVRIEGFEEEYIVLDKMASRWERRIDIYMGEDVEAAREWGKREVVIYWEKERTVP